MRRAVVFSVLPMFGRKNLREVVDLADPPVPPMPPPGGALARSRWGRSAFGRIFAQQAAATCGQLPRLPAMVWLLPLPVGQPVSCIRQPIARAGHGLREASCSVLSGVGCGGGPDAAPPRSRPAGRQGLRRKHTMSLAPGGQVSFSASTRGKELRSAFFSARPARRRTDLRGGESMPHAATRST
jgi:hypothetical protein